MHLLKTKKKYLSNGKSKSKTCPVASPTAINFLFVDTSMTVILKKSMVVESK